jgi:hypothetical protein
MTDRNTTRLTSFVLAVLTTWTVFSGIDAMALSQHAGATQMSQSPAATQLAGTKSAPRS